MKRIILCVLVAASGLAKEQEPSVQRPAYKAAVHGHFWPEAANTDVTAARKLAQWARSISAPPRDGDTN